VSLEKRSLRKAVLDWAGKTKAQIRARGRSGNVEEDGHDLKVTRILGKG